MENICVIPARYGSSRLKGKPLIDICGKPMVWWVYNEVKKANIETYIATDDMRIKEVCDTYNMNVLMTDDNHVSGIDRVCEVMERTNYDNYMVVMGDEPLIDYRDLNKLIEQYKNCDGILGKTKFTNPVDVVNSTTFKIVTNKKDELMYISRSPIPYPKGIINFDYYKVVGISIYSRKALEAFKNNKPSYVEQAEGTEVIRFIENDVKIKMIDVKHSLAVDTLKDVIRVKEIIRRRKDV